MIDFCQSGSEQYDAAGNVTSDGLTQYLYDGEGRICASAMVVDGTTAMTGYVYDAEGNRVAKGTIAQWSCSLATNGFATTTDYILGSGNETMTEMGVNSGGALTPQRNYAYAGASLIATYEPG